MNTLRRINESAALYIPSGEALTIAAAQVVAKLHGRSDPVMIDYYVEDATHRFKVDRDALERAVESSLKGGSSEAH